MIKKILLVLLFFFMILKGSDLFDVIFIHEDGYSIGSDFYSKYSIYSS